MDAGMAERLAASMDPQALGALQNHNNDPNVARAVAAQFGSFLMQGMMQDADGGAMSVAGGTGGAAVSSMFASAMGRYAMSGDKLGLADTIYRSMTAKAGTGATAKPDPTNPPAAAGGATGHAQSAGISLAPYWQDGGHRPFGAPSGHLNPPADPRTEKPGAARQAAPAAAVPAKLAPPPPHPTEPRAHWHGLSLPPQAHVLLPPPEPDSEPAVASVAAAAASAPAQRVAAGARAAASDPVRPADPAPAPDRTAAATRGAVTRPGPTAAGGSGGIDGAEKFAEELAPAIEQAAARLGVSPRILLAQAALETGWGHSVVGNNIFGIKAGESWSGATVGAATHEMEHGHLVARHGTFRAYANVAQAVDDYVSLVSASSRYRAAIGAGENAAAYASALAAGGYASDRDYAAKLVAVANSAKMSYAVASLDEAVPGSLVSAHG